MIKKEGGLRVKGQTKNNNIEKPLITIATVVCNGQDYLEETILSIVNQKYENLEFIIIDGGSTDKTIEIIKKYEHVIDYWVSENDDGIYDAMNKASNLAKGQWINYMNCGDTFCNNEVVKKIQFKNYSKYAMVYGNAKIFSDNKRFIKIQKSFKMNKFTLSTFITRVVCHQAVFYNTDIKFNYPKKYKFKGELYSYFEYLKYGKAINLNLEICNFVLGGIGKKKIKENFKEVWSVLKEQVGILRILYIPMNLFQIFRSYK